MTAPLAGHRPAEGEPPVVNVGSPSSGTDSAGARFIGAVSMTVIDLATPVIVAARRAMAEVAAIVQERRDGPRYVEAVRGGRRLRSEDVARNYLPHPDNALKAELSGGVPVGWITR